jgi:hypothetical protein
MVSAFPDDSAPTYRLRDRDRVYGKPFQHRVTGIGIEETLAAPQSLWQNPFVERLIGSIRRECLNHVLVLGERHLRRILTRYFSYYHQARTHLALDKDAPDIRPIALPARGRSWSFPKSAGCTIATSVRLRSTGSSLFLSLGPVQSDWPLSLINRASGGPVHGRHSGSLVCLSQARRAAVARGPRVAPRASDQVLVKDKIWTARIERTTSSSDLLVAPSGFEPPSRP